MAATIQGVMRMFACYEEILKEEKRYLSRQISGLDFILIVRDSTSPRVLIYIEGDGPDEPSVFQQTGLSP